MLPDLSLLLALVLGLFSLRAPEGASIDWLKAVGGTAAIALVVATLCRMAADRAVRGVDEAEPGAVVSAGARLSFVPLLGWISALTFFDWGAFVASHVPVTWLMAPYVVFFLPLGLMFASGWLALRRIETRISKTAPTRWGAVARGLKRNALTLLPLAVLLFLQDGIVLLGTLDVPGIRRLVAWNQAFPDFEALFLVLVLTVLTYFAPRMFARVLKAEPLPAGELRTSIERLLRAMGVGFRDVLLWTTNRRVLNAMVVGLTARSRYVFVTDGLLSLLPADEVLAVVAHEAGHAKKRHLPTYFVMSLALMLLLRAAEEVVVPLLGEYGNLVVMVAFLAVFWYGLLGWLSRKFEREADAFGADHAGDLEPDAPPVTVSVAGGPVAVPAGGARMMSALARIHAHTGVGGRHHRHGSPPERVAFLARYATDPSARREFERSGRALRIGLALVFLASLATTAARLPAGLVRGEAALALLEGNDLAKRGLPLRKERPEEARRAFEDARARYRATRAALARNPKDRDLRWLATVAAFNEADLLLHQLGRPDEARGLFEESLALGEDLPHARTAALRFQAHVDLGRLAVRDATDPKKALLDAKRHLQRAKEVSEDDFTGDYRRARTRLLSASVDLREDDPAKAADAVQTLGQLASSVREGDEWAELRDDAAEDLRLAPPR